MAVSLVIPGRNASKTIRPCLAAVTPLLESGRVGEIIFVDDGSTDDTRAIVERFPVRCIAGAGRGPGAARNLGWRAAVNDLIWFIDSDCVAEPDALEKLLPHMEDPKVGGVSGSYGNMRPDSLLACLIHEEIVERHRAMPSRVNFLATFNVVYRRSILEQVDGFDVRFMKGQDAELSWRVLDAGYELAFELNSRVGHFHDNRWLSYLRTQRHQGYWRVWLHLGHKGHTVGDSYSSLVDHLQPPLAMMTLACVPFAFFQGTRWLPGAPAALLVLAQLPMTWRLLRRTRQVKYVAFAGMNMIRSFWRGVGMALGMLAVLRARVFGRT
jgi:glycosyltransferase involved in cell wall biosynthesis